MPVHLFIRDLKVDHLSFSGALAFHKLQARKRCVAFKHLETRCTSALKKLKWLSKSPQYHRFLQLLINFTSACTLLHIIAKCDSYQGVWKLKTVKAACTTFVSHPSSVLLSHSTLWQKLQTFVKKSFALFPFLWKGPSTKEVCNF